jgi:hypothetical protein
VTRYVFIVEDLHLLLLAGLPAHYQQPLIVTRWRVSVMARLERAIPLNGALPPMTRSSRAMTMTGCTGDKLRPLVLVLFRELRTKRDILSFRRDDWPEGRLGGGLGDPCVPTQ